jgi:hypothetical protein
VLSSGIPIVYFKASTVALYICTAVRPSKLEFILYMASRNS